MSTNQPQTGTKKYRFYYHYYRAKGCLSVHWKGACYTADNIVVNVPTESKWKKGQPHLVIQGFAEDVKFENGVAYIN